MLEELVGVAEAVGPLDTELVRISDEVVARGAEIADEDSVDDELADVQIVLDTIDQIVGMAFEKGVEMVRIGTLGAERVRDFAEFEILHSQAIRDLAEKDMDAVDAVLPRLSGLAIVLAAPKVTVMYDDVVFRRLVGSIDDGSDQVFWASGRGVCRMCVLYFGAWRSRRGMQTWDAGEWGFEATPLDDALAFLEAAVETLGAVDWAAHSAEELAGAVGRAEIVVRRLEAAGSRAAAELAGLHRQKGRSAGGVAAMLAQDLGLARGTMHGRIEAGGRQATPAGRAAASGEITGEHERIIAKAVAGLPGTLGGDAKIRFAEELTDYARSAAPADLRAEAARRVAALCPDRGRDREEHQERQRSARLGAVRPDGTSTLTMTLTARGRALVERALWDFGGPGGTVPCEPGSDDRSYEQRAHDALVHQWALGSTVDPSKPRGIATIIVRLTPEQLEDPGAMVRTDSGTQLSVRQAVSMAGGMPWFVSVLRGGREELHRIDVDAHQNRRLASAIQRLVLYAAHGGCTFPGCTAPARRSQFHHVREWSRGGPTTVANGALCCPVHHGFVGEGPAGWKTVVNPDSPGLCTWLPPGIDRLTDV